MFKHLFERFRRADQDSKPLFASDGPGKEHRHYP
jgi:hypothetical protein